MTAISEGISLCACMGPIGSDPHCPCAMDRMGLEPTNPWTPEKIAELDEIIAEFEQVLSDMDVSNAQAGIGWNLPPAT